MTTAALLLTCLCAIRYGTIFERSSLLALMEMRNRKRISRGEKKKEIKGSREEDADVVMKSML